MVPVCRSLLMHRASIRTQVVRVLLQELSTARNGGAVGVDCVYMMHFLKGEGKRCAVFMSVGFFTFWGRDQIDWLHIAIVTTIRCTS